MTVAQVWGAAIGIVGGFIVVAVALLILYAIDVRKDRRRR